MKIVISNRSEQPIYAQIELQIKEQILSGELAEGETLPSIRKLAKEIGVSVITTTRAYSDLEKEGYIATVQGKGSVVLSRDNDLLREQYYKRIEEGLTLAIDTAQKLDMEKGELITMLDTLWETEE
ncbi:MAG: GntR family transcriptional regulator [Blautia sp.]|nr:GntR family transcriptional regulator [Blautia sp.]